MEEMRLADERLNVLEHPLIAHKMSIMRDGSTAPSQFRQLVHEVAMLEVYEASRDLATELVEVETPLQRTVGNGLRARSLPWCPSFARAWECLTGFSLPYPLLRWGCLAWNATSRRVSRTNITRRCQGALPTGRCF